MNLAALKSRLQFDNAEAETGMEILLNIHIIITLNLCDPAVHTKGYIYINRNVDAYQEYEYFVSTKMLSSS